MLGGKVKGKNRKITSGSVFSLGLFLPLLGQTYSVLHHFNNSKVVSQALGKACSETMKVFHILSNSLQTLPTLLNNTIQNTTNNSNTNYYLSCKTVDSQIQECTFFNSLNEV